MVLPRFFNGQTLLTVGLMAAVLSGCGQKGKLYMPDEPPPHTLNQAANQEDCRTPACASVVDDKEQKSPEAKASDTPEPLPEETPE